jgi:hypothetical protein
VLVAASVNSSPGSRIAGDDARIERPVAAAPVRVRVRAVEEVVLVGEPAGPIRRTGTEVGVPWLGRPVVDPVVGDSVPSAPRKPGSLSARPPFEVLPSNTSDARSS